VEFCGGAVAASDVQKAALRSDDENHQLMVCASLSVGLQILREIFSRSSG